MSSAEPIAAAIQAYVDAGELAGAATLVWQDGKVVQSGCIGWRDADAGLTVERDTLFRIASMTKPITSAVALMLLEEGKFALDEPIASWAPEFARMRVLRSPDGALDDTDPADRPITFADLLTHRSGLTYGAFHTGPIAKAHAAALGGDIDSAVSPNDWISGLSALPLIDQPGSGFHYGHSTDLLGFLIARMEDAPLGDVLARRLFYPLGMKDTGFTVPSAKYGRRARLYGFDESGKLTPRLTAAGGATLAERPADMEFVSGGQGLWSTVDDYLAFARMFVDQGQVDGQRLLKPETLALMTRNHLSDSQRRTARMLGMPAFASGNGFGMGVAVVLDPATASPLRCRGGVGTVGWPGAFGGWWQADPTNQSVMIFLAHNVVELEQISNGIGIGVFGASMEFHALASSQLR